MTSRCFGRTRVAIYGITRYFGAHSADGANRFTLLRASRGTGRRGGGGYQYRCGSPQAEEAMEPQVAGVTPAPTLTNVNGPSESAGCIVWPHSTHFPTLSYTARHPPDPRQLSPDRAENSKLKKKSDVRIIGLQKSPEWSTSDSAPLTTGFWKFPTDNPQAFFTARHQIRPPAFNLLVMVEWLATVPLQW